MGLLRSTRLCRVTAAVVACAGALLLISLSLQSKTHADASGTAFADSFQRPLPVGTAQCPAELHSSPYRQRLNVIRPLDTAPHSKTLGVAGRIYVVHLPSRQDRYKDMSKLGRAMDLEFTWHNATNYRSDTVQQLMERVRWWRNNNRQRESDPKADPSPFVFRWADDVHERTGALGFSGADLWTDHFTRSPFAPLPPPPVPDDRPPTLDVYGEGGHEFKMDDHVRPAPVSCWHSHYEVLRKIAEGDDEVAIVLEDDVDMEWDLEARLRGMWDALPPDWDIVMIGYCAGEEWTHPPLKGAASLRETHHTLCTHAYAINRRAAQHVVRRLRSEAFAYSRPIDHAFVHLYYSHHITLYSVYPPVVVQTYDTQSDIAPGNGGDRVQWLVDSAKERIALAEAADNDRAAVDGKGGP